MKHTAPEFLLAAAKTPSRSVAPEPSKARLTQTLTRAFANDPMMTFIFPEDNVREEVLPWFLGSVISYCQRYGEVESSPDADAVACWLTPGNTRVTPLRQMRGEGILTPFKLGFERFGRLMALQNYMTKEHHAHAPEPHYYLYLLGVDPASWGRGLGRNLMGKMLARADSEGVPCYLETQNEKNVAVYEKVGFEVMSSGKVDGHDLNVWTLKREANAGI